MTPQEFCYWLQGVFEVGNPTSLDAAQTKIVRDHLALVFKKVTPPKSEIISERTMWEERMRRDLEKRDAAFIPAHGERLCSIVPGDTPTYC